MQPDKHCIAAWTTKTPSTCSFTYPPSDTQTLMGNLLGILCISGSHLTVRLPCIKDPSLVGREGEVVRPYVNCSHSIGRHPDRFVLTLLGETGHGKTKTVNRLIDNNLLEVARRCGGSTTKVLCSPQMSTRRTPNNRISRLCRGLTCQSHSTLKEISSS